MLDLMLAAVLAQGTGAVSPCHAAQIPAGQSGCPAWRSIATHGGMEMFADPASARRTGNTAEIAARTVYATPQERGTRVIHTILRFDCVRNTVAYGRTIAYNVRGVPVGAETPRGAAARPEPVEPTNVLAAMQEEACWPRGSAVRRAHVEALRRPAGEWRLIDRHGEGEGHYDSVPVEHGPEIVVARVRDVYRTTRADGARSHILRIRIDCRRQVSAVQHITYFDADGDLLADLPATGAAAAEQSMEPGTAGSVVRMAFCPPPVAAAGPVDPCFVVPAPSPIPAACTRWRSLGRDEQGDSWLETVPLLRSGGIVEARSRTVFHAVQPGGVRSYTNRLRVDCAGRTVALLGTNTYRADGVLLDEGLLPAAQMVPEPVQPNPFGAVLFEQFCAASGGPR